MLVAAAPGSSCVRKKACGRSQPIKRCDTSAKVAGEICWGLVAAAALSPDWCTGNDSLSAAGVVKNKQRQRQSSLPYTRSLKA